MSLLIGLEKATRPGSKNKCERTIEVSRELARSQHVHVEITVREPETFDLLGFTHFWCKTKRGGWAVQRKTMKSRLAGAVERIDQWCCKNRHKPIREQWTKLCQKVRGHYAYYAITGNNRSLANFLRLVNKAWKRWLNRRNEKKPMNWEKFNRLIQRYPLPPPKVIHGKHRMFNT